MNRTLILITFIILNWLPLFVYGQLRNTFDSFPADFTKICVQPIYYMYGDTIIKTTLFIKEDGTFNLSAEKFDSILSDNYSFDMINNTVKKVRYEHSTFPDTVHFYSNKIPDQDINLKYDTIIESIKYIVSPFNEDLDYSYVLKKLDSGFNFQKNDTILRILYPEDELNNSKKYSLMKLVLNGDKSELYYYSGMSLNCDGIKLLDTDKKLLKKEDGIKIRKLLGRAVNPELSSCIRPGNPWLFIYEDFSNGFAKGMISEYCTRLSKVKNNDIELYYEIRGFLSRIIN